MFLACAREHASAQVKQGGWLHAKLVHIFSSGQAFQTKTVSQESCPRTAVPRRHRNMCLHDVNRSNTYWRLQVNTEALIRIAAWGGKEKKTCKEMPVRLHIITASLGKDAEDVYTSYDCSQGAN